MKDCEDLKKSMKINYSGIIAEEQCMKASSWAADEPVAHINVVKRLITQVNEAKEENAGLRNIIDELKNGFQQNNHNGSFDKTLKAVDEELARITPQR